VLAKFQLQILKAFKVIALQSSRNRKINLYSKCRENELQALTKTYEGNKSNYRVFFTQEQPQGHYITLKCKNRLLQNLAEIFPIL